MPIEAWNDGSYHTRLPTGAVAAAFSISYLHEKCSWTTTKNRRRVSTQLFQGRCYIYRDTGDRQRSSDGGDGNTNYDFEGLGQDEWTDQKDEQLDEAASPDEFEPPDDVPSESVSPLGSANNAHGLYPAGETPSWARSRATAEVLGVTLAWLKQKTKQNPDDLKARLIYVFVYLQITYAFRTQDLLDARFGEKPELEQERAKSPIIVYQNGDFHITPRRQDAKPSFGASSDQPERYLPSSHTHILPAPKAVASILDDLHRSSVPAWVADHLFIFRSDEGKWQHLNKNIINAEMKPRTEKERRQSVEVKAEPLSEVLGEPIDVDRISRSAATLLIEHGGMNELTAAFVRGHIPRHLASQAFYTNMTYDEVEDAHVPAARRLFMDIAEASREWATRLAITPLIVSQVPRDETSTPQSKHTRTGRIGSPFVPQAAAVRSYLTRLCESINDGGDWRLSFNRFTAYSTLMLMFLTGLRPLELRYLTHQRLALDNPQPTLAVLAKMVVSHNLCCQAFEWLT